MLSRNAASSIRAGSTSKVKPACCNNLARMGEAEASINLRMWITTPEATMDDGGSHQQLVDAATVR
jgi:hypothetical protein